MHAGSYKKYLSFTIQMQLVTDTIVDAERCNSIGAIFRRYVATELQDAGLQFLVVLSYRLRDAPTMSIDKPIEVLGETMNLPGLTHGP